MNYIISPIAATKITAGKRAFPNHQPPVGTQVISRMDDLAQWQLVPDEQTITTPLRRPGKFDIRQVNDAEKGACLELELKREGEVPHVVGEYTALRLKSRCPFPASRTPLACGSRATAVGGAFLGDRGCQRRALALLQRPRWRRLGQSIRHRLRWLVLRHLSADQRITRAHIEPGAGIGQWQHENGDGKLDYPLRLTGLSSRRIGNP